MVAVGGASLSNESVSVILAAGDEASGLARIIGQYVEQMVGDSQAKREQAAGLRGRLGIRAREGDIAVTVVFEEDGITIEEGLGEPDAVISGEIEFLMNVLAGRANPAWEVCRGRLSLRPSLRRPVFGYGAYRLMRLEDVHVWSGLPRAPLAMALGALCALGVLLLVWQFRRRTSGGADA